MATRKADCCGCWPICLSLPKIWLWCNRDFSDDTQNSCMPSALFTRAAKLCCQSVQPRRAERQ
eukprot:1096878-Pleurochrysis_carterae.AAC.2